MERHETMKYIYSVSESINRNLPTRSSQGSRISQAVIGLYRRPIRATSRAHLEKRRKGGGGGGFLEKARVSRREVMNGERERRRGKIGRLRSVPGMDLAKGHMVGPIGLSNKRPARSRTESSIVPLLYISRNAISTILLLLFSSLSPVETELLSGRQVSPGTPETCSLVSRAIGKLDDFGIKGRFLSSSCSNPRKNFVNKRLCRMK